MRSPRGKADLLNRLFSFDFGGNWTGLGEGVIIKRTKPHIATITFPDIGRTFEIVARIPRAAHRAAPRKPAGLAVGQAPPARGGRKKSEAASSTKQKAH